MDLFPPQGPRAMRERGSTVLLEWSCWALSCHAEHIRSAQCQLREASRAPRERDPSLRSGWHL